MLTWAIPGNVTAFPGLSKDSVSQCGGVGFISCISSLTAVDSFVMVEEPKLKYYLKIND